jgi:cyanophycin synthetase
VYVGQRVDEYRGYWSAAAAAIGATFHDLEAGVWEVRRGTRRTRIVNFVTECDDPVTLHVAGDKPFVYRLAAAAGVPVPEHRVVTLEQLADAAAFLDVVRAPVVVKPARHSSSGLGITAGVRTRRQLASAVALASLYDRHVLVERLVPGESYRLLFLEGRLLHAVRRRGLRVTGDGRRTVADLTAAAGIGPVERDPVAVETLRLQRLALDAVAVAGREVLVRGVPSSHPVTSELRTVYDEAVPLSQCGADLVRDARQMVLRVGSEFAGVDVITTDPTVSLRASGGAFIEINTTPGIHHHYVGSRTNGDVPVAVPVLEHLLSRARPALTTARPRIDADAAVRELAASTDA